MKVFEKCWVFRVWIPGLGVVVIAHGRCANDFNPMTIGCNRQTIDECVVRLGIGTHQELLLGTAARE
jgi:hypothetical protein